MTKLPAVPPPPSFPQPHDRLEIRFYERVDLERPEVVLKRSPQIELARELWSSWQERSAERDGVLTELLARLHRDQVVNVMTCNEGHSDLLENWLVSCDENGVEARSWTLVFALDAPSADRARALGLEVFHDGASYGTLPAQSAKAYGDGDFGLFMFPKTAVVRDVLRHGYDVLFQDVDVLWLRDPLAPLTDTDRRSLDAQFMYDGPNMQYAPLHANTGFFFLRNRAPVIAFWDQVCRHVDKMLTYRSQQVVVNRILESRYFRGLRLAILPEADYANGHLLVNGRRLPADPAVIHCSWTANHDQKLERMKGAGLWLLANKERRWSRPTVDGRDR